MSAPEPHQRDDDQVDTGDTTSTTGGAGVEREEHVGRVAGADEGYSGETGAERRSG